MLTKTKRPLLISSLATSLFLGLHLTAQAQNNTDNLPDSIKTLSQKHGVKITSPFTSKSGLSGWIGMVQNEPITLYQLPNSNYVLIGSILDANAEDIDADKINKLAIEPRAKEIWQQAGNTKWISDGKKNAKRIVYVFTDPYCPYCDKFWADARPWVEQGKVQLRHIMVGIIRPQSPGAAAAILQQKDQEAALTSFLSAQKDKKNKTLAPLEKIPSNLRSQLDANATFMTSLGLSATPSIIWQDDKGMVQMQQGADPRLYSKILGSQ